MFIKKNFIELHSTFFDYKRNNKKIIIIKNLISRLIISYKTKPYNLRKIIFLFNLSNLWKNISKNAILILNFCYIYFRFIKNEKYN